MKQHVHVALCQVSVDWLNPERNREHLAAWVERAVRGTSDPLDLIVFPELSTTGYVRGRSREFGGKYLALAERIPGETTGRMQDLAKAFHLHIAFGLLRQHGRIPHTVYNSGVLVGPDGVVGIQDKLHIPGEEKHYFCEGEAVHVFHTAFGAVGLIVCYDAIYPEVARLMALDGAEILVILYAGPKYQRFVQERLLYLTSVRAVENRTYVLACKLVGLEGDLEYYGGTGIAAPTGEVVAWSGEAPEEKVIYGRLDEDLLREERAYAPVLRDRRPALYSRLALGLAALEDART